MGNEIQHLTESQNLMHEHIKKNDRTVTVVDESTVTGLPESTPTGNRAARRAAAKRARRIRRNSIEPLARFVRPCRVHPGEICVFCPPPGGAHRD
jgi:t-SNARE complex subunit (syntaxin)